MAKLTLNDTSKNGPPPASFSFTRSLSNKHYNFYNEFNVKNLHPVYCAGIRTHDLSE